MGQQKDLPALKQSGVIHDKLVRFLSGQVAGKDMVIRKRLAAGSQPLTEGVYAGFNFVFFLLEVQGQVVRRVVRKSAHIFSRHLPGIGAVADKIAEKVRVVNDVHHADAWDLVFCQKLFFPGEQAA